MRIAKGQGIYAIINKTNGKAYIGSTGVGFAYRWNCHLCELRKNKHGNQPLQRAWAKYGEDSFEFVILEIVNDRNAIPEREQYWIEQYVANGTCYNIKRTPGADGGPHCHSEETKRKIGDARRGYKQTEEHKRKIGNAHRGIKESEETTRKMSERAKGKDNSNFRAAAVGSRVRPHNTPIIAPDGTIYESVTDIHAFCREHGLTPTTLTDLLNGKKVYGHRGWRRLDAPGTRKEIIGRAAKAYMSDPDYRARCMEGLRTPENIEKARQSRMRISYAFVAPDGATYRDIRDLRVFCAEHGLHLVSMRCVHSDKQKAQSYKGWRKAPPEE
jgi:group I intron endonuclease